MGHSTSGRSGVCRGSPKKHSSSVLLVLSSQWNNFHTGHLSCGVGPSDVVLPEAHSVEGVCWQHCWFWYWIKPQMSSPEPKRNYGWWRQFCWNNSPQQGLHRWGTAFQRTANRKALAQLCHMVPHTMSARLGTKAILHTRLALFWWPWTATRFGFDAERTRFRKKKPNLYHQSKTRLTISFPYTELLEWPQDQRQKTTKMLPLLCGS